MAKIVLEIKKPLRNGDILVYKEGEFIPCDIRILLPELKVLRERIDALEGKIKELEVKLGEHDALIAKNAHEILVDRGLADE